MIERFYMVRNVGKVLVASLIGCLAAGSALTASASPDIDAGPVFDQFHLTLAPGIRQEAIGPLYYFEKKESNRVWAVPPVFSYTLNTESDFAEFDFFFPLLTYDRFGPDYRFQIFQVFNFSGGQSLTGTNVDRFTLFPIYFQERSAIPERNYTAVFPIYGHLSNRFFRSEVDFVMWPLYVKSRRRTAVTSIADDPYLALAYRFFRARKGDMTTYNFLYPIFHLRYGDGLSGWQAWPLVGNEHKDVTIKTNMWGDAETISGHKKFFALWPIYFNQTLGLGTTNIETQRALLPFYSLSRAPQRESSTYLWPLGFTYTVDRERKFTEWAAPWPLIVFDRGEGKTTSRVWPFYSHAQNDTLESDFFLWPLYKYNRLHGDALDRSRTRILFFLYSDVVEKSIETGATFRRSDFWPLFTARREFDGSSRLQVFAPLEPFVPYSKSIERDYSPLWSVWRAEKNKKTGATSQSLLWNLYRRDTTPQIKKCSLLFGLFQYQSTPDSRRWRLFYLPIGRKEAAPDASATAR